jgi:predicted metal-dependent phosphoesterase TrpH
VIVDLHTHSTASDGELSPAGLVRAAAAEGVEALALTDHDTIDGLAEAEESAQAVGVAFIRGVEIEIDWPEIGNMEQREFHLLGLGLGKLSPRFQAMMLQLRHKREKRNRLMLERMNELGIPATFEEIRAGNAGGYLGRPHFAEYLTRTRITKNADEAFRKYLGRGKALYIPKGGVTLRRAVSAIKESGGLAILAHPTSLYIAWGRLPGVLARFKDAGLDGLEAYHPTATARESERLCALAKDAGFFVSAGSDFHGAARRDRKLARLAGNTRIDSALLSFPPPVLLAWGIS